MNDSGNSNGTIDYVAINSYAYAAAVPASIIGLIANTLMMFILMRYKIFHKTTYFLLRISVASDIISNTTTAISYLIVTAIHVTYPLGVILCRIAVFVILSSYGISIMTLCIIAIDRYFAIVKPLSSFYRRNKFLLIGGLLTVGCLLTFSITIPALFFVDVYHDDTKFCDFRNVTPLISFYFTMSTFNLYIIPAVTLATSYGNIIVYMRNYVRPGEDTNFNRAVEDQKRKKFIKALSLIASSYLLISWPFFATSLGMAITGSSLREIRRVGVVYYLLAFFSFSTTTAISIINPFLYLKFDHAIQLKAKSLISQLSTIRTAVDSSNDSVPNSTNKSGIV
ncbi:Somatostatin receptor type 4 [Trichoplax sp. H2]|nr:Somatostatin receptor type 4 [Trichoplax sp. H2]|eukprot:RDD36835.1 Somatostatin receptor type 4 [Trichoplax sp. H2]